MNLVIGAGVSGLSAAQALGGDCLILERNTVAGGLAGQYQAGGYSFDHGGHYFHFQGKPEVRRHVERFHAFRSYRRDSKVFLLGRFIPYSLQYHLAYLPAKQRQAILEEMRGGGKDGAGDLEQFLLANFGPHFFRLFFRPYLMKFYRRPLSGLLSEHDRGSIPVPRLADVLTGAREKKRFAEGYNPVFFYPLHSLRHFIDDYSRPVRARIRFSEKVIRVEPRHGKVFTTNGVYRYERLVNTMPLKELLGIISPAPPFPRQRLRHLSTLVIHAVLAVRRRRFHWLYLPEKRFPFYRVGYYPGAGAVTVYLEKTIAAGAPLDRARLFREMTFTLLRTGMIAAEKEVIFHDLEKIPVSYVVFDREWPRLVPTVLEYLRKLQIHSIGRYGSWDYSSMADDIQMALATAGRIGRR